MDKTSRHYKHRAVRMAPRVWHVYDANDTLVAIVDDTNATRPRSAYKRQRTAEIIADALTVAAYKGGRYNYRVRVTRD